MFAVGGEILHYNGSTWSAMSSGMTNGLSGVWGSGPSDVFAVGGGGTILHYTRIQGDLDGDGHVDVVDLLTFADSWSKSTGDIGYDPACDFNSDGTVDTRDLLILAEHWSV